MVRRSISLMEVSQSRGSTVQQTNSVTLENYSNSEIPSTQGKVGSVLNVLKKNVSKLVKMSMTLGSLKESFGKLICVSLKLMIYSRANMIYNRVEYSLTYLHIPERFMERCT